MKIPRWVVSNADVRRRNFAAAALGGGNYALFQGVLNKNPGDGGFSEIAEATGDGLRALPGDPPFYT